jgi:hypothetical protein
MPAFWMPLVRFQTNGPAAPSRREFPAFARRGGAHAERSGRIEMVTPRGAILKCLILNYLRSMLFSGEPFRSTWRTRRRTEIQIAKGFIEWAA